MPVSVLKLIEELVGRGVYLELSIDRIRSLIYALLDFNSIDDLKAWLVT